MAPAPIAVFAFNRPDHLRRTLRALAANDLAAESRLTIFCDGPRNAKDKKRTDAVRAIAHAVEGFYSCNVIEQEKNCGLANSIIAGISDILQRDSRIIVLEDDLITSKYFLKYINDGLDVYKNNKDVASIHGWCFPHTIENPQETFFLRGADCWGWGTWKRAWSLFEPDAQVLLQRLRQLHLEHAFNCDGAYDYMGMLRATRDGKVSSWAVRWRASAFVHHMHTLYPSRSLVKHNGADGSGTNFGETDTLDVPLSSTPVQVLEQPAVEDNTMHQAEKAFLERLHNQPSFSRTLRKKIRHFFPFLPSRKTCKALCKDCLPPVVWRAAQRLRRHEKATPRLCWEGDYPDWQSAVDASTGYDQEAIFVKVRDAARAVRDGKALWERDSVLFYHKEHNLPLLSALMSVAAWNRGRLRVLDFGGAFGSVYWQHKPLLHKLDALSWNVVEQPHVVACGQKEFSTDALQFWPDMESCAAANQIDVVLFSSVLQYLEFPYERLQQALTLQPYAIIIDRTPFASKGERLTVQHVSQEIYPASYACRWLNKTYVKALLEQDLVVGPWWQSQVDPLGFLGVMGYRSGS
ncbi:methyltransferase, TIGR04325 family [uncultured Desulfovibrio sp.]|uniref:methyltransferase, TIGR04325 family n=1 Tax=uncultured Desulfovibrio sp. TaxID=167968 RepID=UPI0025936D4F|nr:methyltransferase, TIGR04325 family [uncultured Desulfovibrio sp.]